MMMIVGVVLRRSRRQVAVVVVTIILIIITILIINILLQTIHSPFGGQQQQMKSPFQLKTPKIAPKATPNGIGPPTPNSAGAYDSENRLSFTFGTGLISPVR